MKRHGVRLITAALATAVAAACFSDPTSSLRNGPASVVLSRSAAIVPIGDSTLVEARVVDQQGNVLPATGAVWTTDSAAVAAVAVAASQVPADGSSRAYIKGIATLGGITDVRVTVRGLTASVRVTALPTRYFGTGTFAVTGTATADTTPLGAAFTAGDTITITAPAGMTFDAAASVITLGGTGTYTLSRSATAVKALVIKGYRGQATVTNVTWLGNATTGDYSLESLNTTDTVTVARGRFRGGAAVSTAVFGTNTLLTLTAQAGTTFNTTGTPSIVVFDLDTAMVTSRAASTITAIARAGYTGVVRVTNVNIGTVRVDSLFSAGVVTVAAATLPNANVTVRNGGFGSNTEMKVLPATGTTFTPSGTSASVVMLGADTATILFRSADSIVVIHKANYTGTVKVTNLVSSGLVLDSLRTTSPSTLNASYFLGTVVQAGTGRMLDTIYVIGGPRIDFTTSGTTASNVTINGTQAFIIRRAADTLYVIASKIGTSKVSISNVLFGTATVPSLSTSGTITISATTGEANEPGNDDPGGATVFAGPVNVNDTVAVFDATSATDVDDYFKFTAGAAGSYRVVVDWLPRGIDVDAFVLNSVGGGFCGLDECSGATGADPEVMNVTLAAGTAYQVYINLWDAHGNATPIPYRVRVIRRT